MTALERRLVDALKRMQQVTTVLGKGVGNITTPDGFFKLWNEAEIETSSVIALVEGSSNVGHPVSVICGSC